MSQWIINGIRSGIKTTGYPKKAETAAGVSPGLPAGGEYPANQTVSLLARCPTEVFRRDGDSVTANPRRCIHCYRCARGLEYPVRWQQTYEWGTVCNGRHVLDRPFHHSMHICVVDAGDCGACLSEIRQLNNPYYNMHRLGLFITPTPRHADVLLAVGPVTDHMKFAVQKIFDAMPTPKRVVVVGACALSGGVFAGSFACGRGLGDVLPVDVEVPGCPPPPLAILHGLLMAAGRKPPASRLPETTR